LFCQGAGTLICQIDHLICQGSNAPGKTKAINLKETVSSRLCVREDTVFDFIPNCDIMVSNHISERKNDSRFAVMIRGHNTAIVPNMIIVSHFSEFVKDEIHYIFGEEDALCPECGHRMKFSGRCRRHVFRQKSRQREKLSLRVFYCPECHRYHRELPDFIVPFKHFCLEIYAAIYDALNDYVDDHTAARICRWVKGFLVFGAATVRRLKLEHPSIVTNYGINSTSETLRYFVRVVVNVGEWKQYEFM
jgi:hypothetical protein